MPKATEKLGRLRAVYGTSPVLLQRAAITAIVAFIFFLAMLIAFSIRQNFGYFILATAFLVVQLFTLTGWITQRKNELKIFENGFTYRKKNCFWNEIAAIEEKIKNGLLIGCTIVKTDDSKIVLTDVLAQIEEIISQIKASSRYKIS